MEELSTIDTLKAEVKKHKESGEHGTFMSSDRDSEDRVEALKLSIFRSVCDVEEVDKFLWHL